MKIIVFTKRRICRQTKPVIKTPGAQERMRIKVPSSPFKGYQMLSGRIPQAVVLKSCR